MLYASNGPHVALARAGDSERTKPFSTNPQGNLATGRGYRQPERDEQQAPAPTANLILVTGAFVMLSLTAKIHTHVRNLAK